MSRLYIFIITLSFFSLSIYSQDKFQIGFSTGIVSPIYSPQKIGLASQVSFTYNVSNNLGVYTAIGNIIYGYYSSNVYNTNLIPVILGMKYSFGKSTYAPFISFELEKIYGESNYGERTLVNGAPIGEKVYRESAVLKLNDLALAGGIGLSHKINNDIGIELNCNVVITSQQGDVFHVRLLIGFVYTL